jgi:four helix bundle protein
MANILIIDDDPDSLKLLRMRLEKAGHTVLQATDGEEGLRLALKTSRLNLVFLDIRIPKMDGWQVCRNIKSNPETMHLPVVMLTGCSQDTQELYGRQCGADEYIIKPWDGKYILQVTANLLDRSKSALDIKSTVMQQRIKQFIQRITLLAGQISTLKKAVSFSEQLIQLATSCVGNYQSAVQQSSQNVYLPKMKLVDQQFGELMYWLGLLHDSKVSDAPEIPLLIADGAVLQRIIGDQLKRATQRP